jgi:hypothetical protein
MSAQYSTKPAHQTKQKRAEHLPLSTQALVLVASIIEARDSKSPFLFPGNKPGYHLCEIRNSGSPFCVRRASPTIAVTTTGTRMRRVSFLAALVWRSSDDCWGIRRRKQPSAPLISQTIRCGRLRTGLARKSPASSRRGKRTVASHPHERKQDRRFKPARSGRLSRACRSARCNGLWPIRSLNSTQPSPIMLAPQSLRAGGCAGVVQRGRYLRQLYEKRS